MYTCQYCGKEYVKQQSLASHLRFCSKNLYNQYDNKIKNEYKFKCKHCNKEYILFLTEQEFYKHKYSDFCSQGCANSRCHSEETKKKIGLTLKNSGKLYIAKPKEYIVYCKNCGKEIKYIGKVNYRWYCSEKCKNEYKHKILGGYRKGSGRGHEGWYKGIFCDSSWELAFLVYYLEHNLYIQRCKEKREYIWNNKKHIYLPDFITNEGIIEIKGYNTEQSEAKRLQNPDIKYLYQKDIQYCLDYTINKYGNKFWEILYEK